MRILEDASSEPGALQLAGEHLDFVGLPDWARRFEDPETAESLHRWNWLLGSTPSGDLEDIRAWGLRLSRSWLRFNQTVNGLPGRNTYSTGERISNFGLFWLLNGGAANSRFSSSLPPDVGDAIAQMAEFVAAHLEYHGESGTGNHPFNNGRALYIAAILLNDSALRRLALATLSERLEQLITPDGFLREGSSHYHLLFTRWVLELRWVAEMTGDLEVVQLLSGVAPRLVQRCWFFVVAAPDRDAVIPLIGDVSPDCSPSWLTTLPWSPLALSTWRAPSIPKMNVHGWAALWPAPESQPANATPTNYGDPVAQAVAFKRYDAYGFTLFIHAEAEPRRRIATHRHGDLGGFVLFFQQEPLLIDVGRSDYQVSSIIGRYGLSGRAHNTVLIDGLEPQPPIELSRLPDFYRRNRVTVESQVDSDCIRVVLRHDGFSRITHDLIEHIRVWRIDAHSVEIEDSLQGRGRHLIETRFHWGPTVRCEKQQDDRMHIYTNASVLSWQAEFGGNNAIIERIVPPHVAQSPGEGQCWQAYRAPCPITMFSYTTEAELAYQQRFKLRLG